MCISEAGNRSRLNPLPSETAGYETIFKQKHNRGELPEHKPLTIPVRAGRGDHLLAIDVAD